MGLAKVHSEAEQQSELRGCLTAGWSNCNAMVSELVQDQRQDRQSLFDLFIYKHGVCNRCLIPSVAHTPH